MRMIRKVQVNTDFLRAILFYLRSVGFIIFLFQLFNVPCLAQQPHKWTESYTFRNFGIREGLVQSQALFSFQDAYGYMWFTTLNGVSRFDGLQFENYSMNDLQSVSHVRYIGMYETAVYIVSANNIIFIYPDRSMEFYPLPENYLSISYTERFMPLIGNQLYLFNCLDQSQQSAYYTILQFDLENKTFKKLDTGLPFLWPYVSDQKLYAVPRAIKNRQLSLYRMDNDTLRTVHTLNMEKDDYQIWLYLTNKNEWFGKLCKAQDVLQQSFHLCRYFVENDTIRQEYITPVTSYFSGVERIDEHRLILSSSSAYILDMDKRSLSEFPLETRTIHFISIDRGGNLWFSTDDGVYQCNLNFMEYRMGLSRKDDIFSVIRDSRNSVWFTSYTNGFWRADKQGVLYKADLIYQQKKISNYLGYMSNCEDNRGQIFVVFNEGVAVYDPRKGDPNRLDVIHTGFSMAVYYDAINDVVYFSGSAEKSFTLNALYPDGTITTYPFGLQSILSICRDGNQKLRIGTYYNGEAWLDEKSQTVVFDTITRPYKSVICMTLDENGTLWKCGNEGLFTEDKQGNDRQIIDQLTVFVVNYHNRYIIFGTERTLYLLDLPAYHRDGTIQVRAFGYYDGFDVMSCCQNGASIDRDGYVWLAGTDKAIRFLPEQLMTGSTMQPQAPYLAAIYKADRSVSWQLVPLTTSMLFDDDDNYLRFDLLQASLSSPDKLTFRYRLKGYDERWRTTGERTIIFQNLLSGKYQLEVQSSFDGQQWSESIFSPPISIKPPFIMSLFGMILILIGFTAINILIVYYTRKIIMRQEEEKRNTDRLKLLAIRSKFIPHFTGNVLNSINYLIHKNPGEAQRYISDFSEFSTMTLLNTEFVFRSIKDEIDYTKLYLKFEKLRFEERLEYDISVEAGVNLQLEIPCMVIHTLCENALKHGLSSKPEGGMITVSVYLQDGFTVISVEDNGIGRKMAQQLKTKGSGEGLKIVQQQLDILNKNKYPKANLQIIDLYDTGGQPSGMKVEVWIFNG